MYIEFDKVTFLLILFLFLCIIAIPLIAFPEDSGGWILFYLSFLIPLLGKEIRKSWSLYTTVCVTFIPYHATSIVNHYVATTITGVSDAQYFHSIAVSLANGQEYDTTFGVQLYTQLLSLFYQLLGDSLFVGTQTSVLAYAISCIFFVKIIHRLTLEKYQHRLILLYGLLPSHFMFCAVTLRESWQILFFMSSLYYLLKMKENITFFRGINFFISALLLGFLHKGLVVYIFFLIAWGICWVSGVNFNLKFLLRKRDFFKKISLIMLTIILLALGIQLSHLIDSTTLQSVASGDALNYTDNYRSLSLGNRADYGGNDLDTSSFLGFITTFPSIFFLYMFAPLPWQIDNVLDIYAFGESILRLILIFGAFRFWQQQTGLRKQQSALLLTCFFIVEILWSLGTKNWGTAIRHHLVGYFILVILGSYQFWNIVNLFLPSRLIKRK